MNLIKNIYHLIGFINYLVPPPLNKYVMKFRGVKFDDIRSCWIGSYCFFDTLYPELITIERDVTMSFCVKIACHFEPTKTLKLHGYRDYARAVRISEGSFIGMGSIIFPGVIVGKGAIISAGSIVSEDVKSYHLYKDGKSVPLSVSVKDPVL